MVPVSLEKKEKIDGDLRRSASADAAPARIARVVGYSDGSPIFFTKILHSTSPMQIVQRTRVFDGFYKVSQLRLQDGKTELTRERFEPGHAAAALVYDTEREVYILAKQYRIGPEKEILELAAGMIDGDDTPEATIRREIHEELGYEVDRIEPIVTIWPSPGANAESIAIFYAEVSQKTGSGGGLEEENEKIDAAEFSFEALVAESFQDAKTMIAVQWLQLRK